MGQETAAIVIACILQRAQHINSAGGYLRALTDKARAGQFSVGPMLMAALKANSPRQAGGQGRLMLKPTLGPSWDRIDRRARPRERRSNEAGFGRSYVRDFARHGCRVLTQPHRMRDDLGGKTIAVASGSRAIFDIHRDRGNRPPLRNTRGALDLYIQPPVVSPWRGGSSGQAARWCAPRMSVQ